MLILCGVGLGWLVVGKGSGVYMFGCVLGLWL